MKKDEPLSPEELKAIVGGAGPAIRCAATLDPLLHGRLDELTAAERLHAPIFETIRAMNSKLNEIHSHLSPSEKAALVSQADLSKRIATA